MLWFLTRKSSCYDKYIFISPKLVLMRVVEALNIIIIIFKIVKPTDTHIAWGKAVQPLV